MTETRLAIEQRSEKGKAAARRLRRSGRIPAVIYGEVKEPIPISIDDHTLTMLLKQNISTISLSLDDKKHQVIVRDIQYHPVKDTILHVDFMQVKKGHKITMSVPVRFEGKPAGVKEGGIMDMVKHEIEIAVLPKDIPDEIIANIEDLALGEAFRVKDLITGDYEVLSDPESVLCRVEIPRGADTLDEEGEEEVEEEMAEPEIITSRDKEGSEASEE